MKKFWIDVFNVDLGRQVTAGMFTGTDAKEAVEKIGLCLPNIWHASRIKLNETGSQEKMFVSDLNGFRFILHISFKGETGDGT